MAKTEQIQKMITRKQGATTSALIKATGRQAHSVRAALSGLRKKGVAIRRSKNGKGESVYRVEA